MRIRTGDLVLDTEARSVEVAGKPLRLTSNEYRILELLSLHKHAPLAKAAILDHLYGGDADRPELKMIEVFVAMLRKKIADASGRAGRDYVADVGAGVRLNDPSRSSS